MQKPPLDPDVADTAPSDSVTAYDKDHLVTYLRLLDADAERADWREVARLVLQLDPEHESDRARRSFDSHLSRQMDDGARLPAPATWRRFRLRSAKKNEMAGKAEKHPTPRSVRCDAQIAARAMSKM
jgi:hypothetical protein